VEDAVRSRFEVVKGDGPDQSFVELWDNSLAPRGLAFEVILAENGDLSVIGHGLAVPIEMLAGFIQEALAYLRA